MELHNAHDGRLEIEESLLLGDAIRLGSETNNALLLDYYHQFLSLRSGVVSPQIEALHQAALEAAPKWLDTPLASDDASQPASEVLRGKITRTMRQAQALRRGDGYMFYVAVPALDEADNLPPFIESFSSQIIDDPVVLLIADNNSTDNTAAIARGLGGNVTPAVRPGIGAARQQALKYILDNATRPDRTIIVQTDADCESTPAYLTSVAQTFKHNPDVQIGVGPSVYTIPNEDGQAIRIATGRGYGDLLGTTGLRGYFQALERDAQDYLLEPPFRYLVGPNTTFRASVFEDHHVGYPTDGRWESLDLSVRLQQRLPSSSAIRYITEQCMSVSPRAILGGAPCLTRQRLESLRAQGFVGTFKEGGANMSPLATMKIVLSEIDSQTYSLTSGQRVVGIVREDDPTAGRYTSRPARHAGTQELLRGKVALIA